MAEVTRLRALLLARGPTTAAAAAAAAADGGGGDGGGKAGEEGEEGPVLVDLAALASECSDKDKALIAQRAEDVAKAGVAYGPAFASALDSFAADPEGFAGRETNSNEVVEAAPAALEDAWAALESRDQARDQGPAAPAEALVPGRFPGICT